MAVNHGLISSPRGAQKISKRTQLGTKQIIFILLFLCCTLATLEISTLTSKSLAAVLREDGTLGIAPPPQTKTVRLKEFVTSAKKKQQSDTKSGDDDTISLPIWGDAKQGIDFAAIEAYFNFSSLPQNKGVIHNILYPPQLHPHEFPSPNILYIFGRRGDNNEQAHVVQVDMQTKRSAPAFLQDGRYRPLETLLVDSLEYLVTATNNNNHKKWNRLKQYLNKTTAGIPLIVNLDDHRHCSEGNLFVDDRSYNVPVWTMAAGNPQQDYCHFSFPLPTYSTMELVKEIEVASREGNHSMNFANQDANFPWESKQPSVLWQGTSSGVPPLSFRP